MNLRTSVERLPDSIRQLIMTEPTIKIKHEGGRKLEEILGSSDWAEAWMSRHGKSLHVQVLRWILARFAGQPFEMETLIKSLGEASRLTGAEIRIAVSRLRRSGIVHAIRKAWGDQLFYLPADCISVWQPLLIPLESKPLPAADAREVAFSSATFRLPLSLELLSAWREVYRLPISWTAKGALHRPPIARMTAEMRLTPGELACLSLSYPHDNQMPEQAALAIDLGLCCKVLRKEGNEIRISDPGLAAWLSKSPIEADIELHALIMNRYGANDPAMHLTASAVLNMNVMEWYYDEQLETVCGHKEAINDWLELLQTFGWLERGILRGKPVFRKKEDLQAISITPLRESGTLFVQPDGEILVPPEADLRQRWVLSEIADRVTTDAIFVYRLTRMTCAQAYNAGYTLQSVISFLEQGSQTPLPEPVTRALQDWFLPLGKVRFAEVMLLRTENQEIAADLRRDPESAGKLLEQVGDRDFIIDPASYKFLRTKLQKMGYPPVERIDIGTSPNENFVIADEREDKEEPGWVYRRHVLSAFEADRTLPGAEDLFPGMTDIPATWISRPRAYHSSTRKELIQRAIEWEASIHLEHDGKPRSFVPRGLREDGTNWSVVGQWRASEMTGIGNRCTPQETVEVQADEINELMIALPSMEELETN